MSRYRLLSIWLFLFAGCVFVISRTTFTTDMSAFMPKSPTPTQQLLIEQLRDGVVSKLILVGIENLPAAQLAQLSKDMAAQLRKNIEFTSVTNGERIDVEKDFELLWKNRYLLSSEVSAQRFSAEGLRASLANYMDLLATPMSGMVQRLLPNDPSGELLHLFETFENQAKPNRLHDVWFSRDGQRAMLLMHTKESGSEIDAQEHAMQSIQKAFDAAKEMQQGVESAQLLMTGPGVFSVQSRASIRDDAWRLSLIAMLLVSSMLWWLYRSASVLALGLLPVLSGALAGVVAVSLVYGSVHGITLGFGVTLIGECVDYAIYLFTQQTHQTSPKNTLRRLWPTLRLGVLTSICGFSAMLFSGFTGLAQLGLFSIFGLIAAVATTRWILPELLPAGFVVRSNAQLGNVLMKIVKQAPRMKFYVLGVVALCVLFILFRPGTLWNDSLSSMNPVSKAAQLLDEKLRTDIGAPDVRFLIVSQAIDQESALQQSEILSEILIELVKQGKLEGFDSPTLYFPSIKTQKARKAALPEDKLLRKNMGLSLSGFDFKQGIFEPFIQDVATARKASLLNQADLQETNLRLKVDSFLVKRADGWAVMLPLRGVKDANAIIESVTSQSSVSMLFLDMKHETEKMFTEYRREATKYSILGALAIVVLLLLNLKSIQRVVEVTLPLVAAVVVVTTVTLLTGKAISIFHLIGLLLVVAIGSNYALFFAESSDSNEERARMLTSLLFANLSTMLGFGLLSLSQSPVLNAIGSTVAAGALLSLLFSVVLISRERE